MGRVIKVDFGKPPGDVPDGSWRPIESVPKDGSDVLLVITYPHIAGMPDEVVRTRWADPKRDGHHGNCYRGWSGERHSGTASLWQIESCRGVPIQWMPMPKAPSQQLKRRKRR